MKTFTPQPKESKSSWHFQISLAKSAIRILAGGVLFYGQLELAGVALVLAEVLGIIEEL